MPLWRLPAGVRSLLFDRQLIPGLCRVLRRLGGREEPICDGDAGGPPQAGAQERHREPAGDDGPDSECPAPSWERSPERVTFQFDDMQKLLFSIRGRMVEVVNDAEDEGEA